MQHLRISILVILLSFSPISFTAHYGPPSSPTGHEADSTDPFGVFALANGIGSISNRDYQSDCIYDSVTHKRERERDRKEDIPQDDVLYASASKRASSSRCELSSSGSASFGPVRCRKGARKKTKEKEKEKEVSYFRDSPTPLPSSPRVGDYSSDCSSPFTGRRMSFDPEDWGFVPDVTSSPPRTRVMNASNKASSSASDLASSGSDSNHDSSKKSNMHSKEAEKKKAADGDHQERATSNLVVRGAKTYEALPGWKWYEDDLGVSRAIITSSAALFLMGCATFDYLLGNGDRFRIGSNEPKKPEVRKKDGEEDDDDYEYVRERVTPGYGEPGSYMPYYSSGRSRLVRRKKRKYVNHQPHAKQTQEQKDEIWDAQPESSSAGLTPEQRDAIALEGKTPFFIEAYKQKKRLEFLHAVVHGCAEPKQKALFERMFFTGIESLGEFLDGDWTKAYQIAKKDKDLWQTCKAIAGGVIGKYVGESAERALFGIGFYDAPDDATDRSGSLSLEALHEAEENIRERFPQWNEATMCPAGIGKCPRMGAYGKSCIESMDAFFDNITEYEERTQCSYFDDKDRAKVFTFVQDLMTRICGENIFAAMANKNATAPNDQILKGHLKVMNYLRALPIHMHDIEPHWEKNNEKIEQLLDFLPDDALKRIYDYMGTLMARAQDPHYGQRKGDAGKHLLFSGPTGSSKTYSGEELPKLLGYMPMRASLVQLIDCVECSDASLEDLVDGELSDIEKTLLILDPETKKPRAPLNPVVLLDEGMGKNYIKKRNISNSDVKYVTDQFKRFRLPRLGLNIPGYLNLILTNNAKDPLRDPALISRITQIFFPRMTPEKKEQILYTAFEDRLQSHPYLHKKYSDEHFKMLVRRAVAFNDRVNIRLLLDNVDTLVNYEHLEHQVHQEGKKWLRPKRLRKQHDDQKGAECESYAVLQQMLRRRLEFHDVLQRTFGHLTLEELSDSDSDCD